jgi:hypothetical protein
VFSPFPMQDTELRAASNAKVTQTLLWTLKVFDGLNRTFLLSHAIASSP